MSVQFIRKFKKSKNMFTILLHNSGTNSHHGVDWENSRNTSVNICIVFALPIHEYPQISSAKDCPYSGKLS